MAPWIRESAHLPHPRQPVSRHSVPGRRAWTGRIPGHRDLAMMTAHGVIKRGGVRAPPALAAAAGCAAFGTRQRDLRCRRISAGRVFVLVRGRPDRCRRQQTRRIAPDGTEPLRDSEHSAWRASTGAHGGESRRPNTSACGDIWRNEVEQCPRKMSSPVRLILRLRSLCGARSHGLR